MSGWDAGDSGAVAFIVAFLVVAVIVWLIARRRGDRGEPYGSGSNPNPSRITDEMWWLWQQLQALEPESALGGIYANKPGYHNQRNALPSYDYSVCDRPPDDGGPGDKAAALDWTFYDAQRGDYSTISKYTKRLLTSAQDPNDPRLNGWREFYGNADDDSYVEGWDCRYGVPATSDSSHLWHIHLSESRDQTTSIDNKKAMLSVLRGETVDEWFGTTIVECGGVLTNCPYDENRQDLFLVGPEGQVLHRWWSGGMVNAWNGNSKSEDLGGAVAVGTLAACWAPAGDLVNIVGLGSPDANAPDGCGQYWGMTLKKGGARSGWGSFENAYGRLPTVATVCADPVVTERVSRVRTGVILLAVGLILLAIWFIMRGLVW